MSDTRAADDIAWFRERHFPVSVVRSGRPCRSCAGCGLGWPCDAARLLTLVDALRAALAAAECRSPTQDGRELVVTARELRAAHRQARELAERAQTWAAAWKRAAKEARAEATSPRARARSAIDADDAAARVVVIARALAVARRERRAAMDDAVDIRVFGEADTRYGAALDALDAAVAAHDAARDH